MSQQIKPYATAVTAGKIIDIAATLSPAIIIMPPGGNQPNEGRDKGARMLSAVAAVVSNFTVVKTYEADDHSFIVSLAGMIDEIPVQFIDQLHFDENNLIDRMEIFLRPANMAEKLLSRVTAEIKKNML